MVLVDHGSREPAANAQLERVAGALRRRLGIPIEIAHLSLARPAIADAIGACAERGVREVVVVPYFLAPGRHTTRDVPALARAAAATHGLRLRLAEPLGAHAGLIDALAARTRRARPITQARRAAARGGSS
ncbi:MAG: CbiX/SirB N-terminal domain-containing protein [Myxococcota bacterium]